MIFSENITSFITDLVIRLVLPTLCSPRKTNLNFLKIIFSFDLRKCCRLSYVNELSNIKTFVCHPRFDQYHLASSPEGVSKISRGRHPQAGERKRLCKRKFWWRPSDSAQHNIWFFSVLKPLLNRKETFHFRPSCNNLSELEYSGWSGVQPWLWASIDGWGCREFVEKNARSS